MTQLSAGEHAYRQLRSALLAGVYAPRQRLIEADIVADLGINRLGIREALARLEHDGLVERRANRGATVKVLTLAEALEVLQARGALEGLAARHAAANATADDVESLRALLAELDAAFELTDIPAFSAAQARLHHQLLATSRLDTVGRLIETLSAQSAQTRLRTILVAGRLRASLEEHRAIVEAVSAGDPDAAELAVRRHLDNVMQATRRSFPAETPARQTTS
jgi:DNA-binding GntR family transcriptional regulator